MKGIILVLLLKLCVQDILCDDSFLSKFHQKDYKVRDYRAELVSYSKKYFNKMEIKTYKYNRTTPAINGTINLKINVMEKLEVLVQCYKFLSNEYRHFPIRFQVNVMKALNANIAGIEAIKNCGNITTFDLKKDVTYYVCNFVIDETLLPPLIPSGRYKAEATLLYLNEQIAVVHAFGEIYTPTPYPKD